MDNITQEINNQIAEYFISDSKEFLFRYEKLREFQTQISNRSKLLIDLAFAIECSLKALIFIESLENEKATYKKIKTHNLKYLFDQVGNESSIMSLKELIAEDVDVYNVSSRYTLDANINFRESNVLGAKYYSTIADFQWLENIYYASESLLDFVESRINRQITTINFSEIDINRELEIANRIKNIHSN